MNDKRLKSDRRISLEDRVNLVDRRLYKRRIMDHYGVDPFTMAEESNLEELRQQ